MIKALRNSWALLLGMCMLMVGNGLQGTTLPLRGASEGFSPAIMGFVMSAYFAGFVLGSRLTPTLIHRVGHVRVFSALASLISVAFIIFPLIPDPTAWIISRAFIGLCFAGVYIVSESWLNNSVKNEGRAKLLSAYSIVQMIGLALSGWLVLIADVQGYELFVVMSILVSLSFAPILLSSEQAPPFETISPLSLRDIYRASPLGIMTIVATGGLFAVQSTMIGQYTIAKGLGKADLATLFSTIYFGGLITQFPISYIADKFDRRLVIIGMSLFAGVVIAVCLPFTSNFTVLSLMTLVLGGITYPMYSVGVAYVNDRVAYEQMAAASAGIMFAYALGAIGMPIFAGFAMNNFGPEVFWVMLLVIFAIMAVFGFYRTTVREAVVGDEVSVYSHVAPSSTAVFMNANQEIVADLIDERLGKTSDFERYTPKDVLDFWLEDVGPQNWYRKLDEVDGEIRERFGHLHRRISDGQYPDWLTTPEGVLATIICLDQFSRNLYRDSSKAFENDAKARTIAREAILKGMDAGFQAELRQFFYLPFCHSEILADQDFAIDHAKKAGLKSNIVDFKAHREIIAQFGRFPYRNVALGRGTTDAEQEFLNSGGYMKLRSQFAKEK